MKGNAQSIRAIDDDDPDTFCGMIAGVLASYASSVKFLVHSLVGRDWAGLVSKVRHGKAARASALDRVIKVHS
eukprot:4895735-Amphidinium_carterae.1